MIQISQILTLPKKKVQKEWKEALHEDVTVIVNAPHWNEKIASNSEANVKADRSPPMPISKLQEETIRIINERELEHEIHSSVEHRKPRGRSIEMKGETTSRSVRRKSRSVSREAGKRESGRSPTQVEVEYLRDNPTIGWVEDTDILERESVQIMAVQDKIEAEKSGRSLYEGGVPRSSSEKLLDNAVHVLTAQDKMEREGKKRPNNMANPFSNL